MRRRRRRLAEAERPREIEELRALAEESARKAEANEKRMDHIAQLIRERTARA